MGQEIDSRNFTRKDRTAYRVAVRRCLDALERMLDERRFVEEDWKTGLELELALVDRDGLPSMRNEEVLARIDDPLFVKELGKFTIELNVDPRRVDGASLTQLESALRRTLNRAHDRAGDAGAGVAMVGILPTLPAPPQDHSWFSENPRYLMLDEAIFAHRREDLLIDIAGSTERLVMSSPTIIPEAACTSVQLHLQVRPRLFSAYWNSAQMLAGPQLAVGANSPYLFGKHLQAETRIELFKQSTDTRPPEIASQGVRPLVTFGDRWVTSIFDLFEDNVTHYPALLPETGTEDPLKVLDEGGTPSLDELRLHNGTVYRWNRPVYDVVDGRPHLRVENRVLPSGPTVVDVIANAAFFYGAIVELVDEERPAWTRMSFEDAERNFRDAAKHGIGSRLHWPKLGEVHADKLVLEHLLPMARAGLTRLGVADEVSDRYLGVIEGRARTRRNGATWQVAATRSYEVSGLSRDEALQRMFVDYCANMQAGEPVHTWEIPNP